MVGQALQGRAEQKFAGAEVIPHERLELQRHLMRQDELLVRLCTQSPLA